LAGEHLATFFEGFRRPGDIRPQALRVDAVGELFEDGVGREEGQDEVGVAVFDGFQVAAGGVEVRVRHFRTI
jgi:hypothetical protein